MKISNVDPASESFKAAFAAAQGVPLPMDQQKSNSSSMPILVFIGFIFTAPYLVMKLLGAVTKTASLESKF